MPENLALYILLLVALAVGFLLGRRDRRRPTEQRVAESNDYFEGLNHLLNERHDLAIDAFVTNMAVDKGSVDTHLALGSLVRRRGEVDQAIRIHQNLLARSALSAAHRRKTELELARDYLAAGLLDRAENLLLELADGSGEHRRTARELLLEIYQQEKEWAKAVAVGAELARGDQHVRERLAHYECELAEAHIAKRELRAARAALSRAGRYDADLARVPLLGAELEMAAGRYRDVCKALRKARQLEPELTAETLPLYRAACEALERPQQYLDYLFESVELAPSPRLVEEIARTMETDRDHQAAVRFRLEKLASAPTLEGFVNLLERLHAADAPLEVEEMAPLIEIGRAELDHQPRYRCRHCGFGSRSLMWQCPSCRNWGVLKPAITVRRAQG